MCDCTDAQSLSVAINSIACEYGRISGFVHAAYPRSPRWGELFEEVCLERLSHDLSLQLGSAIICSKQMYKVLLLKVMEVLCMFHRSGIAPPKFAHYNGTDMSSPIEYSAIKSGIISITRWLAKYSFGSGVRFNCISPGGILDDQPSEFLSNYLESCAQKGMLDPCDITPSVCYLLSDLSATITGHNLVIDDGWSL